MIQFDEHIFQMGWFNHQCCQMLESPIYGMLESPMICWKSYTCIYPLIFASHFFSYLMNLQVILAGPASMNLAGLPGMVNADRPTGPMNLGRSWAQIIPGVHHKNLVTWENWAPKDWQVAFVPWWFFGFLLFFRVVSGDYGKPWFHLGRSSGRGDDCLPSRKKSAASRLQGMDASIWMFPKIVVPSNHPFQ